MKWGDEEKEDRNQQVEWPDIQSCGEEKSHGEQSRSGQREKRAWENRGQGTHTRFIERRGDEGGPFILQGLMTKRIKQENEMQVKGWK